MSTALLADRDIRPGPPPVEVLRYWRAKGLKVGFNYRDVWREEHDFAFTAAKVMRHDVLGAMQEELDRSFDEGVPFAKFTKNVEPRMRELGWWDTQEVTDPQTGKVVEVHPPSRLATIYETNMRSARAVGQYDRIQRQKDSRPFLLYQVGPSARHREQHLAWHGLLLPVEDDFWTYAFPPNGWGCKCHVRTVGEREYVTLVRDGVLGPTPQPVLDDEGRPTGHVLNQRVAVVTKAPSVPLVLQGIDPGFDKKPGEGRRAALVK
jgi:uncharacterized protein with gpF-like domain